MVGLEDSALCGSQNGSQRRTSTASTTRRWPDLRSAKPSRTASKRPVCAARRGQVRGRMFAIRASVQRDAPNDFTLRNRFQQDLSQRLRRFRGLWVRSHGPTSRPQTDLQRRVSPGHIVTLSPRPGHTAIVWDVARRIITAGVLEGRSCSTAALPSASIGHAVDPCSDKPAALAGPHRFVLLGIPAVMPLMATKQATQLHRQLHLRASSSCFTRDPTVGVCG